MEDNILELENFKISNQALQSIVRLAAEEVEGVELVKGFIGSISERFGVSGPEKSIKIEVQDSEVEVVLDLRVDYGVSIPEVAQQVQFRVKGAMESMTSLRVRSVNVNVEGINFSQTRD
jgi:uncharacterized alkaline shock family protein YloU